MFEGMKYVYEVYKERSFSKAAKKMYISQPSLSANIKRVETKVGYPIFDRTTKPLGLTEFGKKYIQSVEQIMSVESDFSDFINDWTELKTGTLVLGGSNLFSSWVLPSLMGQFARKYPMVKIVLVEESTAALTTHLQNGDVDLVLDYGLPDENAFEKKMFRKEHLLLAVPKNFEVNQKLENYQIRPEWICNQYFMQNEVPVVPVEAFREEPFIMLKPGNDTRKCGMRICGSYGFIPRSVLELDQQMTSYNVTCSGMGISFIGDTLVTRVPGNNSVVYYKLPIDLSERKLYFYWKCGRYMSRVMEEFLLLACRSDSSLNMTKDA